MTALIDPPPELEEKRQEWRLPGRWIIGGIVALILGAVLMLMFTASDSQDAAQATKDEAVSLAQTIEAACASGTIPEQFRAACSQAPQTRNQVEQISGPTGAPGIAGAVGPQGPPGVAGSDGTNGATGATGSSGQNGSSGLAGADGSPGAVGATGATGPVGPPGPAGPAGATGAAGPAGPAGADGRLPASYTVQRSDGTIETCTFNGSPPPDYVCTS